MTPQTPLSTDSQPTGLSATISSTPTFSSTSSDIPNTAKREAVRADIATPIASALQAPYTGLKKAADTASSAGRRSLDAVTEPLQSSKERNTKNLGMRLAGDAISAAAAGGLVAPLISMIDRGIIENASGRATLRESIKASFTTMLFRPQNFFFARPFLLIFGLYSGTYLSANTLDTVKATLQNKPASSVNSGIDKFAATSAANLSLCLYKDSQFTRMFGAATGSGRVPPLTYGLFALRDSLTILASFNLVPVVAPMLPMTAEMEKFVSRTSASQFICPATIQLISTPLHLWGLDVYNRNGGVSFLGRMQKVAVDYVPSAFARMCRIVPAFGVGGVVNTRTRAWWMKELE